MCPTKVCLLFPPDESITAIEISLTAKSPNVDFKMHLQMPYVSSLSLLPTQHLYIRTQVEVLELIVSFVPQQISKSPYQINHGTFQCLFSPSPSQWRRHIWNQTYDPRSSCLLSVTKKNGYIRCIRTTIQDHHVSPPRAKFKSRYQKTQLASHVFCPSLNRTHVCNASKLYSRSSMSLLCPTRTTNTHIPKLKRLRAGLCFFVSLGDFNPPYENDPVVLLCLFYPFAWARLNPPY